MHRALTQNTSAPEGTAKCAVVAAPIDSEERDVSFEFAGTMAVLKMRP